MFSVIVGHLGSDAVAANSVANIVKNMVACVCLGIVTGICRIYLTSSSIGSLLIKEVDMKELKRKLRVLLITRISIWIEYEPCDAVRLACSQFLTQLKQDFCDINEETA